MGLLTFKSNCITLFFFFIIKDPHVFLAFQSFYFFYYFLSDFEAICDQDVPAPWEEDYGIYAMMVIWRFKILQFASLEPDKMFYEIKVFLYTRVALVKFIP